MLTDEEAHEYEAGTYPPRSYAGWRRISWGAIFAGVLVTLAIFLTLQILGAGIGAATIDLTGRETSSPRAMGVGAAIWWFVIGLLALFIGGWVAGRLSGQPNRIDRLLHGLAVWSLFSVVMFWLATTTLSALAGGSLALLGQTASAAGQAVGAPQVQQTLEERGLSPEVIRQEIAAAMGTGAPQQADSTVVGAVSDYFQGPQTPQDRQQLAQVIAQRTGMSEAQANQMIGNLERRAQQAKETGEKVVNIAGATFIGIAVAMLLDALAAMLGGLVTSAPHPIYPRERTRGREVKTGAGTYTPH